MRRHNNVVVHAQRRRAILAEPRAVEERDGQRERARQGQPEHDTAAAAGARRRCLGRCGAVVGDAVALDDGALGEQHKNAAHRVAGVRAAFLDPVVAHGEPLAMRQSDPACRRMHAQIERQRRSLERDAADDAVMRDLQPFDRNVFGDRAREIKKAGDRDAAGAHCLDAVVEDRNIDERAFRNRHQPAITGAAGRLRVYHDTAILIDRDGEPDKDKGAAIGATAERRYRGQIAAFNAAHAFRVDTHKT